MNKASQGIFEIDGFEISKDTTVERFKESDKYEILDCYNNSFIVESCPNTVEFCGKNFGIEMDFYDGKLQSFKLSPYDIDYRKYDTDKAFSDACFSYCEEILDSLFDESVKKEIDEDGVRYFFEGGIAGIGHMISNGRDHDLGGDINVTYGVNNV